MDQDDFWFLIVVLVYDYLLENYYGCVQVVVEWYDGVCFGGVLKLKVKFVYLGVVVWVVFKIFDQRGVN